MGDVALQTEAGRWRRWRTVNATDNGFPSKITTATRPAPSIGSDAAQATSAAVWELASNAGGKVQNTIKLIFYGAGSENNTFLARLIAWNLAHEGNPDVAVWVPTPLFEVTCTLSTAVGVGSRLIASTDRFADTIALTANSANDDIDISIRSPAANYPGVVKVDMEGPQLLEMIFTTGGVATSCNAAGWMY